MVNLLIASNESTHKKRTTSQALVVDKHGNPHNFSFVYRYHKISHRWCLAVDFEIETWDYLWETNNYVNKRLFDYFIWCPMCNDIFILTNQLVLWWAASLSSMLSVVHSRRFGSPRSPSLEKCAYFGRKLVVVVIMRRRTTTITELFPWDVVQNGTDVRMSL